MNLNPLISIIIPTYKRSKLVRRAIDSVRNQTYQNTEILVVDDCSPDDTRESVTTIPDKRIRYIRHDINRGLPAVRNTGIRSSHGELIAFLDDDDEWTNDKLEKQLKLIRNYDAVLSMGISNGLPMRIHSRQSITLDDLRKGSFNPSSLLARKHVFSELKFDETLKQGEDWDAFIRIAEQHTIGWINEPLLLYNEGEQDRMTSVAKQMSGADFEKQTPMLYKHREFFGEWWFQYHLADTYLAYIGSRPNKIESIRYAIRKCGLSPVVRALRDKIWIKIERHAWKLTH